MASYEERAQSFGFASKEEVLEALKDPTTVVLDVRTKEEIENQGKIQGDYNWTNSNCTPVMCPTLETNPESILPDPNGMQ